MAFPWIETSADSLCSSLAVIITVYNINSLINGRRKNNRELLYQDNDGIATKQSEQQAATSSRFYSFVANIASAIGLAASIAENGYTWQTSNILWVCFIS